MASYEKEVLRKPYAHLIPKLQFGCSRTFKYLSIGIQSSIDVQSIYSKVDFQIQGEYILLPQIMSLNLISRFPINRITKSLKNSSVKKSKNFKV